MFYMNSILLACKWSVGWLPMLVVMWMYAQQVPRVAVTVSTKMNVHPPHSSADQPISDET